MHAHVCGKWSYATWGNNVSTKKDMDCLIKLSAGHEKSLFRELVRGSRDLQNNKIRHLKRLHSLGPGLRGNEIELPWKLP